MENITIERWFYIIATMIEDRVVDMYCSNELDEEKDDFYIKLSVISASDYFFNNISLSINETMLIEKQNEFIMKKGIEYIENIFEKEYQNYLKRNR